MWGPTRGSNSGSSRMVATLVLATVSTVYPGFLIGALSVQVSAEFAISEARYGWGLGSFFLSAATGSVVLGRLAQRIGPRKQIIVALTITALAELYIAALANSFGAILVGLVVCGLMNSGLQTAVNLALTRSDISRLGLAVALKQAGMPAAAVLSGFAVPALALTVGWRWSFVMGAVVALVALVGVWVQVAPESLEPQFGRPPLVSSRRALAVAALGVGLLAFSAGSLNAWVVASGVDAGLGAGQAGAMLGVGAAAGVALRLVSGMRLDAMHARPFTVAAATVALGAVGMLLLGARVAPVHMAATVLAFGSGWIWPVFTNYGIVRTNAAAAGTATGVTQMGVYVGVFTAPLVTGALIESSGYRVMWTVVAIVALAGALTITKVAKDF